jgi:uncharacterized protein (TIGR03083 family)
MTDPTPDPTLAPTGFVASPGGYAALGPAAALEHLVDRQAAFAAALRTGDLDASVPTCPGWSLTRLAWHLGTVHRWAAGAVEQGRPVELEETGPTDRDALVDWYTEGAAGLVALLRATDPAAEVWTFGPKPRTARFWSRRQAHETAMHAEDALLGTGVALPPLAPDLALDGVDEVVTMFAPRQVKLQRIPPLTRSLALVPDEGGGARWVLAGDGATPSDALPDAEATVRGPAEQLVRLLWRRVPLDAAGIVVEGDRTAAEAVLGAGLTP